MMNKKVTVTDIVKMAGINRGTFYLHFESVDDLSKQLEHKLIQNFKVIEHEFRICEIDKTPEVVLEKINKLLMQDLNLYKLLLSSNKFVELSEGIREAIKQSICNNFQVMKYITDINHFKMVLEYVTGGVFSIYTAWIRGLISCDIDYVTKYSSMLIINGLKGVIKY